MQAALLTHILKMEKFCCLRFYAPDAHGCHKHCFAYSSTLVPIVNNENNKPVCLLCRPVNVSPNHKHFRIYHVRATLILILNLVSPPRPFATKTRMPSRPHLLRPLQNLHVSASRSHLGSPPVPVAAVLPGPLEKFEVPPPGSHAAHRLAPAAAVRAGVLQHLQVAVFRGGDSGAPAPSAPVQPCTVQEFYLSESGDCLANLGAPLQAANKTAR